MTNYQKELDLKSMGYRLIANHIWGKPIGYMLFTFSIDNDSIQANFLDQDGNRKLWDSDIHRPDQNITLLAFIKGFESYTRTDVAIDHKSEFHFLTKEEYQQSILTIAA